MSDADRRMVRVGSRHHRIVTVRQLNVIGCDKSGIARRVSEGRLTPQHRGVFLVGPGKPSRKGRWLAAVVAVRGETRLSHRSAARLWDVQTWEGADVDVTVAGAKRASRPGIKVHFTAAFHPDDITVVDKIPVTSVERTLLDLAEVIRPEQLKRAYERAEKLRILDHRKLRELVDRSNGRRDLKALLPLLEYDPAHANALKSELERLFSDLVTAHGLPPYQANVIVEGFEVDAYWPGAGVVVELQSYEWHADREAFERDHAKLGRLQVAGLKTLPLTHRQLTRDTAWVVRSLERLLGVSARSSVGGRA